MFGFFFRGAIWFSDMTAFFFPLGRTFTISGPPRFLRSSSFSFPLNKSSLFSSSLRLRFEFLLWNSVEFPPVPHFSAAAACEAICPMEPEPEPRRWAATYTTQLKQKRKAYHDGTLILHPDTGRLVLLDDAGTAIDARFLRAGESVSGGASLSFPCHLVDVGEPQRCPTTGYSGGSSAPAASKTAYRGGGKARQSAANTCAPRAFVNPPKNDGGKAEAVGSGCAKAAGSTLQEWSAMYTTQLTQKAKKYHDGFLRLEQVNSLTKRIVLLDEEGEVLGSRYLKSGECVESGKKCNFPNYLIEIGEAKTLMKGGEPKSSDEPMVTRSKNGENTSKKMGIGATSSLKFISPQKFHYLDKSKSEVTSSFNKPELGNIEVAAAGSTGSLMGSTESSIKEWSVIYTTQLTQKAKKYHDGVIKLMQVGSHANQIVLLDEEGVVLGSRYLKSGESVQSGTKCPFPNYLIEVAELIIQKNDVESKHSSREPLSHTGPKNGEDATQRMGDKSKSPKFVSPLKFHDHQKSKIESTADGNRPQFGKSTCSNVGDPHNFHVSTDLQRGKPDGTVSYRSTGLGKLTSSDMDDPRIFNDFTGIQRAKSESVSWYNRPQVGKSIPNRMDDPLEFCDLEDGKSVCPTGFTTSEIGKSTFGNTGDPLRTASQILSIMKPPAGLSNFATQFRTSVQSCLKLDTVQAKNSVSTHSRNESSGNAHPTYDHQTAMKQAAFDGPELAMVDIPSSEISNANEQKLNSSSNLYNGNSNGTGSALIMDATSILGLREDESGTADQLVANNTTVDPKCGSGSFLPPSIRTRRDPKIQDLIDDCPSFDLGF
ncbi:uncharacterized protein LOC104584666 isoform X3 [Brachypodium distachyon]|uniref:uncharacterized protein LOC104584666 isoform X3 n=1 Tax=Brachypodium distachyon TaxID=15368 RepID=UPI000D0D202F|nr:uncharacterized protein LOC104584666 isoform X3 [Brachypodium distachyon]|eukprot:XP_024319257.1 uncharacterized protein LOC104584666 isoform X3 [Brachypodium distachyon]